MKTKLISITKSMIDEKELTAEQLIVYAARVSNPENQLNTETSEKLLSYMVKNNHWSPFEMCDMTIEITTSRAIAQQILRHRSFSFQEFSQRYSAATEFEPIELRKAGATNRQSSLETFNPEITLSNAFGEIESGEANAFIHKYMSEIKNLYNILIAQGVAKECARMILPLTTQTTLYIKGSIRSWIHYLKIRTDQNTQLEHRQIAESILLIFKENFPIISKAVFNES